MNIKEIGGSIKCSSFELADILEDLLLRDGMLYTRLDGDERSDTVYKLYKKEEE